MILGKATCGVMLVVLWAILTATAAPARPAKSLEAAMQVLPGARLLEHKTVSLGAGRRLEVTRWTDPADATYPEKRMEVEVSTGPAGERILSRSVMLADRLFVEVTDPDHRLPQVLQTLGLEPVAAYPFSPVRQVKLPDGAIATFDRILGRLEAAGRVGGFRVGRDLLAAPAAVPNDPDYAIWQDDLEGIDAPAAWNISTGSSSVVVAVIDTGMDMDHPDLAANLFHNPAEIPGNGIDDDGNGLVDDVNGWNFQGMDNDPDDTHGHGTQMAGIVGAVGNNGLGIAGINWNCRILPVRVGGSSFPWSNIIQAIDYVVSLRESGVPVTVVNNSYGEYLSDPATLTALAAAVDRAEAAGLLLVAAAGNNGSDNDAGQHFYPSDLGNANVLSVAATNDLDDLYTGSNYGTVSVDLAAPGVSIRTTGTGGGYVSVTGTSCSSARTAGLAALAQSVNGQLDSLQLKALLIDTGDQAAALIGKLLHPVRINAASALIEGARYPQSAWADGGGPLVVREGEDALLEALAVDADGSVAYVEFWDGATLLGTDSDGGDGWSWNWVQPVGEGDLVLRVVDNEGLAVRTQPRVYRVLPELDHWRYTYWGEQFETIPAAHLEADPDSDGQENIWEYATGGNPLSAGSQAEGDGRPVPLLFDNSGIRHIGFSLRFLAGDNSLQLYLESGDGALAEPWVEIPADAILVEPDPDLSGYSRIRIGIEAIPANLPAFLRLGVRQVSSP